MFTRTAAVVYVGFLLAIVALADQGSLSTPLAWLHAVPAGDKIGHFVLMGLLTLVVYMTVVPIGATTRRSVGRRAVLIVAMLVTLEEATQILLAHRSFSWIDLLSDYLGILAFWGLAEWLTRRSGSCDTIGAPV